MMQNMLLCLVLAPALGASAQQPTQPAAAAGSNWQHVQALPIGASINVEAKTRSTNCYLKHVDTLTCTHGKDVVFQRVDILTVKIPRRGRSALIGMAIGAGAGAVLGAATGRNGSFVPRGLGAVILAVPGAPIGAAVGALTDFARSTVYKAP